MMLQKCADNPKGVKQPFENSVPKNVKHCEDNINPMRQKINEIV